MKHTLCAKLEGTACVVHQKIVKYLLHVMKIKNIRYCLFECLLVNDMLVEICALFMISLGARNRVAETLFCPDLCFSEESDDKLSKSKNDSAGKSVLCLIQIKRHAAALCVNKGWAFGRMY